MNIGGGSWMWSTGKKGDKENALEELYGKALINS